jgi:hypothetical protein
MTAAAVIERVNHMCEEALAMNSLFYFLLFYSGKYTNKYTHTHSVNHRHSWHRYSPVVFLVLSPPFRQKKK